MMSRRRRFHVEAGVVIDKNALVSLSSMPSPKNLLYRVNSQYFNYKQRDTLYEPEQTELNHPTLPIRRPSCLESFNLRHD